MPYSEDYANICCISYDYDLLLRIRPTTTRFSLASNIRARKRSVIFSTNNRYVHRQDYLNTYIRSGRTFAVAEFVTSGDGWNHDHMLTKWEPDLLSFRYRPPVLSSVLGTSRAKRGERHGQWGELPRSCP